jgi:hypothetical protein
MENRYSAGEPTSNTYPEPAAYHSGSSTPSSASSVRSDTAKSFEPVHSTSPIPESNSSGTQLNDESLASTLSHRRSYASGHATQGEEWAEIERLISRMFGRERKANSEEEKTRHVGVVWRNLTVKGVGLGAALQPTNGDIFLGLPRLIKRLLTRGRKGTGSGKPSIRTILDDFSVSIISKFR